MKTIEVAAAIIIDEEKIFCTQRGYGEFKGWWEFPGGKLEEGEQPEEAVRREIKEELKIEVKVDQLFETVEYDYPNFHLKMYCFLCRIVQGEIVLVEHEDARWLHLAELDFVKWLPADIQIIEKLQKNFKEKSK